MSLKLRNDTERAIYGAAFARALDKAHAGTTWSDYVEAERVTATTALVRAEAAVCSHRLAIVARKRGVLGISPEFVRKPEPVVKTTPMQRSSRGRRIEDADPHSAVFCDHANEVPASCPCDPDCYCKSYTCRTRSGKSK